MYKMWSLIVLLITNVSQGFASDQFNSALEMQKNKQYQQAFDLYCTMPVKTGTVMFNMGLIAYYEGQYAKAIALWRMAYSANSLFIGCSLMKRISFAMTQLKKEQQVPVFFEGDPADDSRLLQHLLFLSVWYTHCIPLWIVQVLVILISISIAGLLVCAIHSSIRRKWIVSILAFFGFLLWMGMYIVKTRTSSYAIIQESTQIYRGPGDFFESAGELYPLTEVLVEMRASLWCKVRYQDKTTGWVPEKALYIIDDHAMCGIDIVKRSDNH